MAVTLLEATGRGDSIYNVPAGTNRLVVVATAAEGSAQTAITPSAMSLGGVALTKVQEYVRTASTFVGVTLFYLKEADIAAASGGAFAATWGAGTRSGYMNHVFTFAGVDQTTPLDDHTGGNSVSGGILSLVLDTLSAGGYTAVAGINSTDTATHVWGGAYSDADETLDNDDGNSRMVAGAKAASGSSMTITVDPSTGTFAALAIAVRPAPAGTPPAIADASDEVFNVGESITITGSDFGASQGTGTVKISPTNAVGDVGAVAQTVTAWSNTSITITVVKGTLSFLSTLYLFVTNNDGQSNASGYAVQLDPKVFVRETLIDLDSNPVAGATGLRAMIWRSEPTAVNAAPAQVIDGLTTNGSGLTAWEIDRGALIPGDPIWLAILKDGTPYKATLRKIVPSYE